MIQLNRMLTGTYLGMPCIVIAMDSEYLYLVDSEGKITKAEFDTVTIDWKYDNEFDVWVDFGPLPEEFDGEKETNDGGSSVQGRFPDSEGTGGSYSSHEEDGEARSMDSGEEDGGED